MIVVHGIDNFSAPSHGSVLTVGNFDGVHRAHRALIAHARTLADAKTPVIVLTFEPHPLAIVGPKKSPPRLTLPEDKLRLLDSAGADIVVVARSEPSLLAIEAEAFVRDVLVRRFRPLHLVEGPSFGFGRNRKGDPALLARLAPTMGFTLHIVEPVTVKLADGSSAMVSSSMVRKLLAERNVTAAAECLARPYELVGPVVHGDGRGRTIGFPTANLDPADQLIPGDGVYAGRTSVNGVAHACAVNVGPAPTFAAAARRVEAHLLDFDGDLYGRVLRLEFLSLLRDQRRFESADALKDQLRDDVAAVRRALSGVTQS